MKATQDPTTGLYDGPDGYARLLTRLAECNNRASANYYLDLMLDHPHRPQDPTP